LCTATCDTDDDCTAVPETPCLKGFTCGIAVTEGPFCCEKVCICTDYIQVPQTGVLPTSIGCDPTNAVNACCNLPGRTGDTSQYPLCKG
jgi:hypothetical protein